MKRDFLSIVATCILTFTLSVSALASGYPAPPDQGYTVSYAKVEWVHQYGGAVQLLQGEPVVMAGTVTGSRADGSKGIVHTYYNVEVQSVLKNESGQRVEQLPVVLTGGIDGEMQTYIRESPVLERGKTYLFVGEPSEEEGAFYPGDGYCGVFSLEEGEDGALTVGQLNPFNESMEQPLQGLTLQEIAQVVSGKIKSGVRIRIVDEQGQPGLRAEPFCKGGRDPAGGAERIHRPGRDVLQPGGKGRQRPFADRQPGGIRKRAGALLPDFPQGGQTKPIQNRLEIRRAFGHRPNALPLSVLGSLIVENI